MSRPPSTVPPLERVLSRCDIGDCWTWTGATTRGGYGHIRIGQQWIRVHRLTWTELVGPIPDGLEIDHLCHVPACVNPDHLRTATRGENARSVRRRFDSSCKSGHRLIGNIYERPDGRGRSCKICRTEATRRSRDRIKGTT